MRQRKYKILTNRKVSDRYWHIEIYVGDDVNDIFSGQFFNILCADGALPFLRRPLSIYRINREKKTIEFLYLVKGIGTLKMTELTDGNYLDVIGPLGESFSVEPTYRSALLVARGVGIATLAALAHEIKEKGMTCVAILSARSKNDLLATESLKSLGVITYPVTEEENNSDVIHVSRLIDTLHEQHKFEVMYTCGSKRLSKLVQDKVNKYKVDGQIALEEHMACGMGVCFACVCDLDKGNGIESVRICKEGPVFNLQEVILK